MLPLALLVGGRGTRLASLGDANAKSMTQVAGRPFLDWILRSLKHGGVERVVLCTGYRGEQIRNFVKDGSQYGLDCVCVADGGDARGTAGAVKGALAELGSSFLVQYGDTLLDVDYAAVAREFIHLKRLGLMTVVRNDSGTDNSNVEFAGGMIVRYDKKIRDAAMKHIDFGLGVFQAKVFASVPERGASDLADLYNTLLGAGELAAFEVVGHYREIGTPAALKRTEQFLLDPIRKS